MDKIKEVKERAEIIQVAKYFNIELNRANMCLCPFHNEKTPSFSISTKKQIWKCFSCGKGGDVISLVQEFLKCNAYESAKHINDFLHLGIEFKNSKINKYDISLYTQKKNVKAEFQKWLDEAEDSLINYFRNARNIIIQANKTDVFENKEFVEACMNIDKVEAYIDILCNGTDKEKFLFYKNFREEVNMISGRVRKRV